MRLHLGRRDLVGLLGLAAAAAFAVSLGLDPVIATELAAAGALLQLVAVLLREEPAHEPDPRVPHTETPLGSARHAVESALAGPWGAQGRFRRIVRDAVAARLDREGLELADVRDDLPPELAELLEGRWDHDRGLHPAELDRILTAVERLEA